MTLTTLVWCILGAVLLVSIRHELREIKNELRRKK